MAEQDFEPSRKRRRVDNGAASQFQPESNRQYTKFAGSQKNDEVANQRKARFRRAQTNHDSISKLHKQIRDLRRLLEHDDQERKMPPGVRIEKERALTGYLDDMERAKAEETERQRMNKLIKRYHKVRFIGIHHWTSDILSLVADEVMKRRATKGRETAQACAEAEIEGGERRQ